MSHISMVPYGCGTGVVGVCQWVGVPGGMAPSVQILYLFLSKVFIYFGSNAENKKTTMI